MWLSLELHVFLTNPLAVLFQDHEARQHVLALILKNEHVSNLVHGMDMELLITSTSNCKMYSLIYVLTSVAV